MKKIFSVCAAIFALSSLALAVSSYAFDDADAPPVDDRIRSSYSACQNFVARFASQGCLGDKSTFEQQFGPPSRVNTSITNNDDTMADYNFDAYTRITLECSNGVSSARCYQKY